MSMDALTGVETIEECRAKDPAPSPSPVSWKSLFGEAAMDDLEQWTPVWKPIEKCREYWSIRQYLCTGPYDPSIYKFADVYPVEKHMKFLEEVRESRGYDISDHVMGVNFGPTAVKRPFFTFMSEKCPDVVEKINERAVIYSEVYMFHKLEKITSSLSMQRIYFLTFTVKQLDLSSRELLKSVSVMKTVQALIFSQSIEGAEVLEWRFKPADSPTP